MTQRLGQVILRNTAWNYVATFVSLGLGLLFIPVFVRYLGDAQYGLWVLVNAIAGYAGLLDLGLATAVVKSVAEYRVHGARDQMNEFLSTLCALYLGLCVIALAGTAVVIIGFGRLFTVSPEQLAVARTLLAIVGSGVALSFPVSLSGGILAGYQRYDVLNWLAIGNLVLGMGSILIVLWAGYGIVAVAVAHVGAMAVTHAIRIYAAFRIHPGLSIHLGRFRFAHVRRIRSYSLFLSLQAGLAQLVLKTDEIVIGMFLPVAAITPYAVGMKLNNAVRTLGQQLVSTLFPVAAQLHGERDNARLSRLVIDGTRMTLGIGLPTALSVLVLADPLLRVWMGPGYETAAVVTGLLLVHTMGAMVIWVPVTVAQAIGTVKIFTLATSVEAALNLCLSVVLVRSIGVVGVALGTALPGVAAMLLIQAPRACRALGISWGHFVRVALLPPFALAVPVFVGLYFVNHLIRLDSVPEVVGAGAVSVGLYWALFLAWGAPRSVVENYRVALGWLRRARA